MVLALLERAASLALKRLRLTVVFELFRRLHD
jgi:hypothetical protein